MRPLTFERTADVDTALAARTAHPETAYLGGGTNLVDLMRLGVERPAHLVDVTRLGHDRVEVSEGGAVRIGAGVPNSDLAADPAVLEHHPLLSQALLAGASGQLRNKATVGGNLLQRTRCGYFQDTTKPCNKRDPGSGCPAIEGDHQPRDHRTLPGLRRHAPVRHGRRDAGARSHRLSPRPGGEREVPMPGLHRLPGEHPERDTVLAPEDLIVAVSLPAPMAGARAKYAKIRERASYAFALVSGLLCSAGVR